MSSVLTALAAVVERLAPRRRRRAGLVAAVVAAVVLAAVVVAVRLTGGDGPAPAAAAPAGETVAAALPSTPGSAAPAPAAPPTATEQPAPGASGVFGEGPADPRDAFSVPELLAMAEPYIARRGVSCVREPEPQVGLREQVSCDLGDGLIGLFQAMLSPDQVLAIREGYLTVVGSQPVHETVRSLRWKPVPGRPGVKTGIRAGSADRGVGTRVRFLDGHGYKWLYFDVDGQSQYAMLATPVVEYDLDDLRSFWADPAAPR